MASISYFNEATGKYEELPLGGGDVAFTSGDEESPDSIVEVPVIQNNEPAKTFREKVSTMVSNVRYLWKRIGNSLVTPETGTIISSFTVEDTTFIRRNVFGQITGYISIGKITLNADSFTVIANIPEGFRLNTSWECLANGDGTYYPVTVTEGGNIMIYKFGAQVTNVRIRFPISYSII